MNRFFRHAVSGVAIALMAAGAAQAAATLPNFVPLAKNAGPAVVNISTEREVVDRMSSMFEGLPPGMERFLSSSGLFRGGRDREPVMLLVRGLLFRVTAIL